jgi:hypothetical protein
VDTQTADPNNFGLIVIKDLESKGYQWLAKNVNLENAELGWQGSTPYLYFKNSGRARDKSCAFELDKQGKATTNCSDENGKKLPPLE